MIQISDDTAKRITRLLGDFLAADGEYTARVAERRRKAIKTIKYIDKKLNIKK